MARISGTTRKKNTLQVMKTTEMLDIEKALQLVEHVLIRSGDEGEHLLSISPNSGDGKRGLAQRRQATRKSLSSAKNLLAVAVRLMDDDAPRQSDKEATLQMKQAIEKLKVAARGAYEAGHLLVGVKRESA
ncbi:hypothetical protein QTH90_10545 [Variovorax sp. J2P1-59]|uniref:hypothetical protein n=1 Tax=Variovorax flavidus TaxID=3053501 RepID=UPI002576D2A7|nr:hypothetical protein [Variovorax sp. J2P1-59]MDM0074821.1 hypothetical protein [Variovorax sp. J2P1-59]